MVDETCYRGGPWLTEYDRTKWSAHLGDNARARRELGYEPRSLEAGLRITLEHEMRQRTKSRTLNQSKQERN